MGGKGFEARGQERAEKEHEGVRQEVDFAVERFLRRAVPVRADEGGSW